MDESDRIKSVLFKPCPSCGKRLPPIIGCTAGLISEVGDALAKNNRPMAVELLLRETDWTRDLALGYLTCPHFVPTSAAQCRSLQETNSVQEDPDIDKIFACWVTLDNERFSPNPGESLLERLQQNPWESRDLRISNAWKTLTDPANLTALEKWNGMEVMNPTAREVGRMALQCCRARAKPT